DKNKNFTEITYIDDKADCKSSVEISKLRNGEFLYSYDLNILDGYNIAKVQGFDALLPITMKMLRENGIYDPKSNNVAIPKFVNAQQAQKEFIDIKVY
ncbi:hypothetical protein, partial [Photobacterium kishitanii]